MSHKTRTADEIRRAKEWKAKEESSSQQEDTKAKTKAEEAPKKERSDELTLVPGTIVKFSVAQPIEDKQMIKKKVKVHSRSHISLFLTVTGKNSHT